MLKSLEFKSTLADASIFTHSQSIIVTLYVNNMLILEKNLRKIEHIKNQIKKLHVMKNLKSISKILEIHMMHQLDDIKINQHHYIQQVLVKFDMQYAKHSSISLSFSINFKRQ